MKTGRTFVFVKIKCYETDYILSLIENVKIGWQTSQEVVTQKRRNG